MLHHDTVVAPTKNQLVMKKGAAAVHNQHQHMAYLEQHEYDEFSSEEMDNVSSP